MSRRILDLSALPWQFGRVNRQPFGPRPADDRAAVAEWLPARVPGDVRADLIAAGRIPPLDTPEGIAGGSWVDDYDWWYRVTLPGEFPPGETIVLEADGIDYYSAIWLDDRLLTTHAGMFARQVVMLSPWINAAEPAAREMAIRVWGGGALPRQPNPIWRRALRRLIAKLSPGTEYFPDRLTTPKAQFSFGWDFTPRVLSAGIWDDIRLVVTRGAYIEDLWVEAAPLAKSARDRDGDQEDKEAEAITPAQFAVRLSLRRPRARPFQIEVSIEPQGFSATEAQEVFSSNFDPDLSLDLTFMLNLASARLWWPWDQGEPRLYRVTVRLLDENGVLDEACQVVGVRSVQREPLAGGNGWRFSINGRPVFLRGANWTPADVLPGRVTEADYARLLNMARDAGVNFLRVWGGGVREKRSFWELCDRLGIMAWQEFPLACTFLDHYPRNRAYLGALEQEARGMIRGLRNHPSLIAWCGGNEINPARERLPLAAVRNVLIREDPGRPWLPASPSAGDVHRWDVWHGYAPWSRLYEETAALVSEFGLQAAPDAATVAEMFPDGSPADLVDPRWAARKGQIAKLRHYAGPDAQQPLEQAIAATQRAQAAGLQAGIEACRLRREGIPNQPPCTGVAFWQLNEPGPAVSWAVIDHAGRPKAAYAMLLRSFQPVLVAARFPWRDTTAGDAFTAAVWLVNDGPQGRAGCRVEAIMDGQIVWVEDTITLPAAGIACIGRFTVALAAAPQALTLRLSCGAETIAINRYDLTIHVPGPQPLRGRITRRLADWLLKSR